MDSPGGSQMANVAIPKAESQASRDSPADDPVGVPKTESQPRDSPANNVAAPKVESQGDSPAHDGVAVPKAESQDVSPIEDGVAISKAEVETAMGQEVIISKMARLDVAAIDWNNRMREVSMKLASKIPYVGQAASIILGIFWPVNNIDIFQSIKMDIENLIDEKILEKELEERQNEIHALHKVIQEYSTAQTTEKRSWLTRWIADAITLNIKLQKSSNNIHFILPTISLALLHLSGLRERFHFGKGIYGEDNSVFWKKELEEAYRDYVVVYFPDIYKKWKVWRADQVVIKKWLQKTGTTLPPFYVENSHATVEDKVSGAKQEYLKPWNSSLSTFEVITNLHKEKMCNDAYTEMAGCLSTTFVFDKIVPSSQDPPYNKELFGSMFLGPYAQDLLLGAGVHGEPRHGSTVWNRNDYDVKTGSLKQLMIRGGNLIDAMQFIYDNGPGKLAGNASGGTERKVDVMNPSYAKGLRMGFSNWVLCFVQVLRKDGLNSSTYGNANGWATQDGVANGPPGYKLRSWMFGLGNGPDNSHGPQAFKLQYEVQL